MIRKTLHFSTPYYLSMSNAQLVAKPADDTKPSRTIPIEDIGVIVLEHPQITVTHVLMARLLEAGAALITCDEHYHPTGLLLNLEGNSLLAQRHRLQLDVSLPLKKQLWQQTVKAKIQNQAAVLRRHGLPYTNMLHWASEVTSGDTGNHEARAAAYYWRTLLGPDFIRDRYGDPPNHLLNYGYAILRATVARGIVATGMLPSQGWHHKNKYNAFALADDLMEPYRPLVDLMVMDIWAQEKEYQEMLLTPGAKKILLKIPAMDTYIDERGYPLTIGLQRTTASVIACFEGESRRLLYPTIQV